MADPIEWLLASDEPWTRYRTLVDLLDRPEDDAEVQTARAEMLAHLCRKEAKRLHPQVQGLIDEAAWPGFALKRHNDAKPPIYVLSAAADFGLRASDPGISRVTEAVNPPIRGRRVPDETASLQALRRHRRRALDLDGMRCADAALRAASLRAGR